MELFQELFELFWELFVSFWELSVAILAQVLARAAVNSEPLRGALGK